MAKFVSWVKKFVREEEGPTMVEYGLMVALVAIVAIAGATVLGVEVNAIFDRIGGILNTQAVT